MFELPDDRTIAITIALWVIVGSAICGYFLKYRNATHRSLALFWALWISVPVSIVLAMVAGLIFAIIVGIALTVVLRSYWQLVAKGLDAAREAKLRRHGGKEGIPW